MSARDVSIERAIYHEVAGMEQEIMQGERFPPHKWMARITPHLSALREENESLRDALRHCDCYPCDNPACNCGSWHRRPSKADLAEDAK